MFVWPVDGRRPCFSALREVAFDVAGLPPGSPGDAHQSVGPEALCRGRSRRARQLSKAPRGGFGRLEDEMRAVRAVACGSTSEAAEFDRRLILKFTASPRFHARDEGDRGAGVCSIVVVHVQVSGLSPRVSHPAQKRPRATK